MYGISKSTPKRDRSADIARQRLNRQADKLLVKAQELLAGPKQDGGGWTKGSFHNVDYTQFCTLGALDQAQKELDLDFNVRRQARIQLEAVMGESIMAKNDAARTTFPQVMMAFDLARVAGRQINRQVG